MEEIFIVATIITIIYCVSKYLEYNYFNEGVKPLKDVVRDCLLVLIIISSQKQNVRCNEVDLQILKKLHTISSIFR